MGFEPANRRPPVSSRANRRPHVRPPNKDADDGREEPDRCRAVARPRLPIGRPFLSFLVKGRGESSTWPFGEVIINFLLGITSTCALDVLKRYKIRRESWVHASRHVGPVMWGASGRTNVSVLELCVWTFTFLEEKKHIVCAGHL